MTLSHSLSSASIQFGILFVRFLRPLRVTLCSGLALCLATAPAAAFMQPVTAAAQAQAGAQSDVIQSIRVEGTERIEPETVISYLNLNKGDDATPDKINAALKSLYATGLFGNISLAMDNGTLVVHVAENPVLDRVTFEGNDAISKDDLEKEVQLKARMVYTLPRVQRDVQRILDLYRKSGRFAATVDPKIVKLPQNRVDLVFEIHEGDRTGVRSIDFIGNNHFSASDLREVISTRETAWWRFFSSTDYYDPDRMNYDKELLRRFYLNAGYVDFRVVSAVAELTPDRNDFFVTFSLDEGPRYKFGKITIDSKIKGLDAATLRQYLDVHQGDWYSADKIEKSIAKMMAALGDHQYAFATVVPNPDRHKDTHTVDLNFTIKQGARVFVGRININGNTNTVDKVIRRQMLLAEGDPFNATALHKSEQNLKDLGFFSDVKVKPVDGAQPDRANIDVDVKEKSTGEVMIGAGYSSTDGPLGDFSISQHNFMGQGEDARIGATVSGLTKQIDTSFTDPYFLDRNLSAGVDLYASQSDYQVYSSYNVNSAGATFHVGYPLSDEIRQRLNYSFHGDQILNVPSTASLYIIDQAGTTTTSSVGQTLTYDTRDSKLNPTLGFITHLDTDIAGAGGSRKWFRVKVGGTQYYPIADKWIISGTAEAGQIWGLDGPTKLNERFFLGGDTLRGFQYAGIGPRDLSSPYQDALGGTQFARGTVDLGMPTPLPEEFGIRAHLFSDVGMLGRSDETPIPGDTIANDSSLHLSAGVGITWDSPFGPIRLDYAEPIIYKSYDLIQHVNFSFGTKF
ncbi:MAG: outer membrane protein assembly factor BamA [Alphaproteobacteria bacterium]|nr:outer membrane protein assembly factor BamA [Alphaproteobacteria bacterium]